MAKCMYCAAEITDDSVFCSSCGKKQVTVYKQVFHRGKMSEDDFIARINEWFASYPKVANVKAQFNLEEKIGLLVNKYILNDLAIEYELLKGNNENQYAVINLSNFALYKKSTDNVLEDWKKANPSAIIVSRSGGTHSRGDAGSLFLNGIGARNQTQLYLLFKFNRKQGTNFQK